MRGESSAWGWPGARCSSARPRPRSIEGHVWLALTEQSAGDLDAALKHYRRAADLQVNNRAALEGARLPSVLFYLDALARAADERPAQRAALSAETFMAMQIPRGNETAKALRAMAARVGSGEPEARGAHARPSRRHAAAHHDARAARRGADPAGRAAGGARGGSQAAAARGRGEGRGARDAAAGRVPSLRAAHRRAAAVRRRGPGAAAARGSPRRHPAREPVHVRRRDPARLGPRLPGPGSDARALDDRGQGAAREPRSHRRASATYDLRSCPQPLRDAVRARRRLALGDSAPAGGAGRAAAGVPASAPW